MRPLRSILFLPASNPRAIDKARSLDCDGVILDLEDAVAPAAKPEARMAAVTALKTGGFAYRLLAIRVNPLSTQWGAEDFAAAAGFNVDAIVVPKVDGPALAAAAVTAACGKPVWAMIESPRGVIDVAGIAGTPGVAGLIAGTADLGKDLRASTDRDRTAFLFALSATVNAARAYGLIALDGVHTEIRDLDGVRHTSQQGAMLGFDGRTVIHPSHIEIANQAYGPSPEAVDEARGLISAHEQAIAEGRGVTTYNGRLVEVLHVTEARRLLAFAESIAKRA